jgi:hypothetical protein
MRIAQTLRRVGLVILAVFSSTCSTGGLSAYSRPGVTDYQKSTDYYECRHDSSIVRSRGKGMSENVEDSNGLRACMSARGYEVR